MGLSGLDSALSGLNAAQQQLSVIAGNISNASTTGYTRKILPQTAQTVNGVTIGVSTSPITRNVDLDLEKEFWTQQSAVSGLNTTVTYLNRIQTFNGPPSSQADIAATLSKLEDSFSTLADDPSNASLQTATVTAASNVASQLNNFSGLITQMRNDTQSDLQTAVTSINSQLQQIANLNGQIKFNQAGGQTTAALEDTRDTLVQSLSQEMGISTFTRADGVLVVQTTQGVQLADETAQTVNFQKTQIDPTTDSTGAGFGIYVGDPASPTAINIANSNLGGQMGALVTLRDTTLPQQQAALDELSEQLAQRFNQQGLTLFTDPDGKVPANTAPNPATTPATAVPYVGFASDIQVNPAVTQNNALVQSGTAPTDSPVQAGSAEVINRIINNTFGEVQTQKAAGTVNLNAPAGTDLQTWLGVFSNAQVTGSTAVSNYADTPTLMAAGGASVFTPTTDSFALTFSETRGTSPPGSATINVSLTQANTDFPINGTTIKTAADQIAAEVNKQVTGPPAVPSALAAKASVNSYGQLVISSRGNVTVDGSGTNGMGAAGLTYLGLTAGTTTTTDPYFTVQVGSDAPTQISLTPGETAADLVTALQGTPSGGVDGLGASLTAGKLTIAPGDSTTSPTFGGSLTITGGPFTATGTGTSGVITAGTGIVAALFGSAAPVTDVDYSSPGSSTSFRQNNLGPGANISTGDISDGSLLDYAQQMVTGQASQYTQAQDDQTNEQTYATQLQTNMQNSDGVNIDEELSSMIVVQTAYSAAARVITAIDQQFQDLLNAFQA